MKLLLCEWEAYMQDDVKETLGKMGIPYETFSYSFSSATGIDSYFERNFEKILRSGNFSTVISLNYWVSIANVCHRTNRPYIAWVYDCPLPIENIEDTLWYPTNNMFCFDRAQYESFRNDGFKTVYHMPLGINVERLDQIRLSGRDWKRYAADASFVGEMYTSEYLSFRGELTDYEKGFLESLIETQYRVYGQFYLESLLSPEFLDPIHKRFTEKGHPQRDSRLFRLGVLQFLSREITRRERLMIISSLSRHCRFNLYSPAREELLSHVNLMGTVDSQCEMPMVFKASKINLNISSKQITVGMPLRVLDILGAGGFLLTNYQEEIAENFRPGIDCVIYESVEDAVIKARYYLAHEEERVEIARNGHEAVKKFSYQNQLTKIFDTVFPEGW